MFRARPNPKRGSDGIVDRFAVVKREPPGLPSLDSF
jgi:hypothetical protein